MVSLALFTAIFLLDSVAFALDGICAQSYSIEACHEQVVREIYATILNPLASLAAPKPKQWAENVKGRISPIGTYDGYEDTKEYFYGLPSITRPLAAYFTYLISTEKRVYSSVEVEIGSLDPSITATANLTQNIVWFFNDAGQVHYYDGVVVDAGSFLEDAIMKGLVSPDLVSIAAICQVGAQFCTGAFQQYESLDECQQFLGALPRGSLDQGASNSVTCRSIHAVLVAFRPELHCPHIGKTGGGKCTDVSYDDYLPFAIPSNVSMEIESVVVPAEAPSLRPDCERS